MALKKNSKYKEWFEPNMTVWRMEEQLIATTGENFPKGLFYGITGLAILNYLWGKSQNKKMFQERGLDLLNKLSIQLIDVRDLRFESGLSGIGWGVEWLAQNNLLTDTNTDEVLSELDDTLYRNVIYKQEENISLEKGILGNALFFIIREKSKNKNTHIYKQLSNHECMVFLTDDLQEKIQEMSVALANGTIDGEILKSFGNFLLCFAAYGKVNIPVIENTLYTIVKLTEDILNNFFVSEIQQNEYKNYQMDDLFFLSICYLRAGTLSNNLHWQKRGALFVRRFNICQNKYKSLSNALLLKKLKIYTLANIFFPLKEFELEINKIFGEAVKRKYSCTLYDGWGTVIIAWISLYFPDFDLNLHELLFV
jgi:hypothetical protein